ncbi:MAG TPA: phosphate acyltransferase PlsX [Burkholderiaceae bacterium]|nr:phosphate acyltransferase PlsX [Burkholderiaceae bacterium]HQR71724.1 phosphate acyltransferase PlsX [Burkholderiaceae bacterium]
MSTRIAIDCMGGDHGIPVTVPAALHFAASEPSVSLLLVGRAPEVERALGKGAQRVEVVHAEEVVEMHDPPAIALRTKRNSSMRVAVNLAKEGRADVVVSAGNTGALMAISRYVLKTLEGIDRPAIAGVIPNQLGRGTTMLDLGANVDCGPDHLLQFAVLGSALVAAVEERDRPTIGLLNIGEELIKGNDVVKQTADLLRASSLNFYGNVEGNDIYKGTTDVVVCDGFVGNVALKTSEGLVHMLGGFVREEFKRDPLSKLMALAAYPVLARFRRRVDPRRYNGASFLGLRGLVVKSHGSADQVAFGAALRRGHAEARHRLLERTIAAMQPFVAQLDQMHKSRPEAAEQGA